MNKKYRGELILALISGILAVCAGIAYLMSFKYPDLDFTSPAVPFFLLIPAATALILSAASWAGKIINKD